MKIDMHFPTFVAVAAWAVGLAVAHPHPSPEQIAQGARGLDACLSGGEHPALAERRAAMVDDIRKARIIEALPLAKRGKEDLEKWLKLSHEKDINNPAWSTKNDELLFDFHTNDAPGARPGACALTPESIYGPYWHEGQRERQDVRDDQNGIYMRLALQVIDLATCMPLEGAQVDLWQANATGVYSEHAQDYLRGWQKTSKWGTADFDTIFPGHYPGRTTHTHVAVRAKGDHHMMHVGQVYYDDWPRMWIESTDPYNKNEASVTPNKDDGVFIEMAASKDYDPFAQWAWLGPNYPNDGLIAWIVLGVNTTATVEQPPNQKRDTGLFDTKLRV